MIYKSFVSPARDSYLNKYFFSRGELWNHVMRTASICLNFQLFYILWFLCFANKICVMYSAMPTELVTFLLLLLSDLAFLCIHTLLCQLKLKAIICRYSTPDYYISTGKTMYILYLISLFFTFQKDARRRCWCIQQWLADR